MPDRHIAWRSLTGAMNAGSVIFHGPRDATEKVADALGFLERRVSDDLERFKRFKGSTTTTS